MSSAAGGMATVPAEEAPSREAGGPRLRLAVPVILAAGWGALLAYSAVFLAEDVPLRPAAPERVEAPDFPDPPAVPLRRAILDGGTRKPEAAVEAPRPAAAPAAATVAPTAAPAGHPDYVGTWGPNAAACGAPHRRGGFYQATITPDRARAGRTVCHFRDGRRQGAAWLLQADCSDRHRRWSSQVRLLVEGERLTWSSARGTATYQRCTRRAG